MSYENPLCLHDIRKDKALRCIALVWYNTLWQIAHDVDAPSEGKKNLLTIASVPNSNALGTQMMYPMLENTYVLILQSNFDMVLTTP